METGQAISGFLIGVTLAVGAAMACSSDEPGSGRERVLSTSQALTTNERVLSFDLLSDWTATAGTLTADPAHTHGASSLGVSGIGYSQIKNSMKLSTLGALASPTVRLDIRVPGRRPALC